MNLRWRWAGVVLCCGCVAQLRAQHPASTPPTIEQLERVGGRVIVGLRPAGGKGALTSSDAARITADLQPLGFTPSRHFRIIPAVSGTIAPGKLRALRSNPNVAYVQPDYPNWVDAPVRHSAFAETTPYGIERIRAPQAWAVTVPPRYGDGVKVGILDTGGDSLHEDLAYAGGYDAVTSSAGSTAWADNVAPCEGHGTHVAGTVAATRGNATGVVGVAPGVSLYAIKIFEAVDFDGSGSVYCLAYTSTILGGFDWAMQNGMQVINMSFGQSSYDEAMHQAAQAAVAQGIVLVAAAGNTGGGPVIYPAANPEVIAVSATDSLDYRAGFSSVGPAVDVAAPGVDVYSTLPNNSYASYSGTSMASPHVTGLAALLRSLNPSLTPSQIREYITAFAVDLGLPGVDDEYGFGRIDALASANAVLGGPPPTLTIVQQPDGAVLGLPLTQQPIVQLADANGVPVAQAGVRISANIALGTGSVSGSSVRAIASTSRSKVKASAPLMMQAVSVLTDQNGIATFTNLTINGVGLHALEFSAPGHVSMNSQEFNVTLPPPTVLSNGVGVPIAGAWGSQRYFVLSVPAGATSVTFTTEGGWGDADLYVRSGTIPDFSNWDCRSWSYTTYESCTLLGGDLGGDWYVMVHGYDAYGDVIVRGWWSSAQPAASLALVQQPMGAPAGELLQTQPTIQLYDQQQQPVQQFGITVTVAAEHGGILWDATLPALSAVTDAQGQAHFDGLFITEPGTHTLTFSAAGLSGAASQVILVSAQLPSATIIGQQVVGGNQLSAEHRAYLDAMGNSDGVFNLGDFMAYLDRAGTNRSTSATPVTAKTRGRGRP